MSNNIYNALEQLGLTAQKRAIHVQFSNSSLNDQVFLQRIDGTHELNSGVNLQLICLSTSSQIPLKQFIGSQIAIDIVNDKSELNRISGIVTKAELGSSDGALTIYVQSGPAQDITVIGPVKVATAQRLAASVSQQ